MLEEARGRYDYVIIDSPPLIPVSDALLLSKLADMMLLVVRWGRTPRLVVGHVLRLLRENKIALTGVLLTRVNMRKHARYNYGGSAGIGARYAGNYR
jgi:Mrp family chromosome partitioning ATPase